MALTCEDSNKFFASLTASTTPKTYIVLRPFTPYDIIQAHAKQFKGADCEEWKRDITNILSAFHNTHEITTLHLSMYDCLNLTTHCQLRDMLMRAGFVGEKAPELTITGVSVGRDNVQKWRVWVTLSDGSKLAVCDISSDGLKLHRFFSPVPFPVDSTTRIKIVEP